MNKLKLILLLPVYVGLIVCVCVLLLFSNERQCPTD